MRDISLILPLFKKDPEIRAIAKYSERILRASIHHSTIDKKNIDFIFIALNMMWLSCPSLMLHWEMIQQEFTRVQVTLADIEVLLRKINSSSLSKSQYALYSQYRLSVSMLRNGMWATRCAQSNYILDESHGLYNRELVLHYFGFYNKSQAILHRHLAKRTVDTTETMQIKLQTISNFFLEDYQSVVYQLHPFKPFADSTPSSAKQNWEDNMLFGISVFSLIEIGKRKKAREQLQKGIKHCGFVKNSIITFCALRLGLTLKRLQNMHFIGKPKQHRDIFTLFEGMVSQFYDQNYRKAICLYHECNFHGAHPIQYYRLYECYLAMGLYQRALRYLERSRKSARGQIPSIRKDMKGKGAALNSLLTALVCDNCGRHFDDESSSKYRLYPCSECLSVWYCSKRCQKIQWNQRHREHCSKSFVGFKGQLTLSKQSPMNRNFHLDLFH